MLSVVSKEMRLLFKGSSEIRKRPDLGCQVSKAKSTLQWLRTDGAKKAHAQKCVRAVCFLSFEFSRCNADARYLNDRADRGKGSAQQRCCHQRCRYHPRAAVRTQTQGWKNSSDSIRLQSWAERVKKLCPAMDWRCDLWPRSPYLLFPFHI